MGNYEHTASDIINGIRNRLQDYAFGVDGAVLLKELLQNADDAGASRSVFILAQNGLPNAQNPLLRGPMLVLFNDGPFGEADRRGLSKLATGTKAKDRMKIGRFGVGQKSIFHLCEAFIFTGIGSDGVLRQGILNPWYDPEAKRDRYQPDWEDPADFDRLRTALAEIIGSSLHWLALVLPYRLDSHGHGDEGRSFIKQAGDEPQRFETMLREGARALSLLPHLRSVKSIEVMAAAQLGAGYELVTTTSASPDGRLGRPGDPALSWPRSWSGKLEVNGKLKGSYWGYERLAPTPAVSAWLDHGKWPRIDEWTDGGATVSEREKAEPHGAATLVRFEGRKTALEARWATYLPMGEPFGSSGWGLLLHGAFLPDHSRRTLPGRDDPGPAELKEATNEALVREGFNRALRDTVTLGCLLPLVSQVLESPDSALDASHARTLVEQVAKSEVWRVHRDAICSSQELIPMTSTSGTRWRLVACESIRLLRIPAASSAGAKVVRDLLLSAADETTAVAEDNARALTKTDRKSAWTIGALRPLLSNEALAAVLQDDDALDYLLMFAKSLSADVKKTLGRQVHIAMRAALAAGTDPVQTSGTWEEVLALVPAEGFLLAPAEVPLAVVSSAARASPLLLIRHPLEVEAPETIPWEEGAIVELIRNLVESKASGTELALKAVIETITQNHLRSLPGLRRLALFSGDWVRERRTQVLSADELVALDGKAFLEERHKLLDVMIQVTTGIDVLRVRPHLLSFLHRVKAASTRDLLTLLATARSVSASASERLKVVSKLIEAGGLEHELQDQGARLGFRYLLHGDPEHRRDPAVLWLGQDPHLASLMSAAQNSWRCIDERISEVLREKVAPRTLRPAGIETPSQQGLRDLVLEIVGALAQRHQLNTLAPLCWASSEFANWLSDHLARSPLWDSAPLHRTARGARPHTAPGHPPLFRVADIQPTPALRDTFDILILSEQQNLELHQKDRIAPWTWHTHLQFALDASSELRQALVVTGLVELGSALTKQDIMKCRSTPWVGRRDGALVAPENVWTHAEELFDDLQLRRVGMVPRRELADSTQIQEISDIAGLFPQPHECAERIVDALGAPSLSEGPSIGIVDFRREWFELDDLKGANDGWRLIGAVNRLSTTLALKAAKRLKGPASLDTLKSVLKALTEPDADSLQESVFLAYLTAFIGHPDFGPAKLAFLKLRNSRGKFVRAGEISMLSETSAPEHAPAPKYYSALDHDRIPKSIANAPGKADPGVKQQASWQRSPEVLARLFDHRWASQDLLPLVGIFLSILGDGHENRIVNLARSSFPRTGSVTVEGVREHILQVGLEPMVPDFESVMREARVAVRVIASDRELAVVAVTGEHLSVRLNTQSVFVHAERIRHREESLLQLRDPGHVSAEVREVLAQELRSMLHLALPKLFPGKKPTGALDEFLARYGDSTQVGVDAVVKTIIYELPAHLRPIKAESKELEETLAQIQHLRQRDGELESVLIHAQKSKRSHLDETAKKRAVTKELKKVEKLLTDFVRLPQYDSIQTAILNGLRRKLTADYHYSEQRVLFELVQNADDAVVQQRWLLGTASPGDDRFIVHGSDAELKVIHFGRLINDVGPDRRGEWHSYDLDLQAMLMLNVSQKTTDSKATGRFGLGFKSVYLLTDRPYIRSGRLCFSVGAGLLPIAEKHDPAELAHETLPPTRFLLPIRPGSDVKVAELVSEFEVASPLLVIFTKALRRFIFADKKEVGWETSFESSRLLIGRVRSPEVPVTARYLVAQGEVGERRLAVALAVHDGRVKPLSSELPTLWVTAPTAIHWKSGFAFSGPFHVDIGRTGLAANYQADNEEVALRLGETLGEALGELSRLAEAEPDRTAKALGLEADGASWDGFWDGLWTLLSNAIRGDDDRDRLDKVVARTGLHSVALERGVPSDLPGGWKRLVQLDSVRWVVDARLCSKQDVLRRLASQLEIGAGLTRPEPGNAISERQAKLLDQIGCTPKNLSQLTPKNIIDFLPRRVATEDYAGALSDLVELGISDAWAGWFEFMCRDGRFRTAKETIIAKAAGTDEHLISQIAPKGMVIEPVGPKVLDLATTARGPIAITPETIATWASAAVSPEERDAVLRYLARGAQADGVCKLLAPKALTWLSMAALDDAETRKVATVAEADAIENRLRPATRAEKKVMAQRGADPSADGVQDDGEEPYDPSLLGKAYQWWERNSAAQTRTYNESNYQEPSSDKLRDRLKSNDNEAWLRLLTLGAARRFGRTHHNTYGNFLRRLSEENVWTLMVEQPKDAATWAMLIERVVARPDDEYQDWYHLIPLLFQCARHLEVYREIYLGLPRRRDHEFTELRTMLSPKSDVAFSGAGGFYRVPSLGARMPKGSQWVLRELLRLGVIEDGRLHRFAWVRENHVGEFFNQTLRVSEGIDSAQDWSLETNKALVKWAEESDYEVEDLTFGGAFDVAVHRFEVVRKKENT